MKTLKSIAIALTLPLLLFSCNKNEFAPELVDQSFTVEENSPKGTIIGIVEASDQDEGQILVHDRENSHGLLLKFQNETPYKVALLASSDHPLEQLRPKLELHYSISE
jgi:hypothetical protein